MRGQERMGTIGRDRKTDNGEGWKGMGKREDRKEKIGRMGTIGRDGKMKKDRRNRC